MWSYKQNRLFEDNYNAAVAHNKNEWDTPGVENGLGIQKGSLYVCIQQMSSNHSRARVVCHCSAP